MHFLIGFAIAVAVGLTGIGGGSLTVPALVLIAGLPTSEAVGTAFVFAGAIRRIAAPFYMLRKHVHAQYLWLLLRGAVPGIGSQGVRAEAQGSGRGFGDVRRAAAGVERRAVSRGKACDFVKDVGCWSSPDEGLWVCIATL